MRPPICKICSKRFGKDEGKGLHFKLSDEDKEKNKRFEKPGFIGHPAGFEWFCTEHLLIAEKYNHLTMSEAMPLIREEVGK
jgi:hypothetical protein